MLLMFSREDLSKTLELFRGSDLIFLSYGEEKEGEYLPHSKGIRIKPDPDLLEETVRSTPLLPNDFGIMPFRWKAKEEEEITHMLLERKLSRWTEGELFAYGYLIIDRVLLDIDVGEIEKGAALKLAQKLKERGIGKVGWTGGGLLAVLELDGEIRVEDRETFGKIRKLLGESIKRIVSDFDPGFLNAGKGVRLIGTISRKREVQTGWILWEEGKRFDLCELIFGIKRETLSKAPVSLKEKIKEKFGIELKGGMERQATPEEVFARAQEFYGELDGMRNEFMLQLSGEMLSAGVDRETTESLYYEYLAHLEKRDRPHVRVKQTIEWVYKEGKTYRLEGDYPEDFTTLLRSFRGEEISLSWRSFAGQVPPQKFVELLRVSGEELYEDGSEVFHLPSGFLLADLRCRWAEEVEDEEGEIKEVRREGKLLLPIFMNLPPCIEKALEEYKELQNGEAEWYLENLLTVSFLLPQRSYTVLTDRRDLELLDSPLAQALVLMTVRKGIDRSEVGVERIRRKVSRSNDGVWNLVRCMNPLLKSMCSENCECYRFRHALPEVLRRKVDKKTGEVREAVIRIEGEELKVEGRVLSNFRRFSDFLEKRGYLLPRISVQWLYQGIMKFSEGEFVDAREEDFRDQLSEMLAEFGEYYVDRFDGKNLWVSGKKFLELLREVGYSVKGSSIKRVRDEHGFRIKRTKESNFTLIPLEFVHEEDRDAVIRKVVMSVEDFFAAENVEVEVKEEITENDRKEEDYVLGRKAYVVLTEEGVLVSFLGREEVFQDPTGVKSWIGKTKAEVDVKKEEAPEEIDDERLSF